MKIYMCLECVAAYFFPFGSSAVRYVISEVLVTVIRFTSLLHYVILRPSFGVIIW